MILKFLTDLSESKLMSFTDNDPCKNTSKWGMKPETINWILLCSVLKCLGDIQVDMFNWLCESGMPKEALHLRIIHTFLSHV